MNIKIVLAGNDTRYTQRLFSALSEDTRFTVSLFTDKESLLDSLSRRKYDVILLDKAMASNAIQTVPVSLLLVDPDEMDGLEQLESYKKINKYQRVSETVRVLMALYAEVTPNVGYYNTKPVKAISVYSPVGGVGKSTIALGLAMAASHAGSYPLYIGLEEFSSLSAFFGEIPGKGLSEIFAKLDSDLNFLAKLQSLLHTTEGVGYFPGFDNPRDLSEITPDNIKRFLNLLAESHLCELVVFDLPSNFTPLVQAVMEQSDRVVLVAGKGMVAEQKLRQLASQLDFMDSFSEKLQLVGNRCDRLLVPGLAATTTIEDFSTGMPLDICRHIANGGYFKPSDYFQ